MTLANCDYAAAGNVDISINESAILKEIICTAYSFYVQTIIVRLFFKIQSSARLGNRGRMRCLNFLSA